VRILQAALGPEGLGCGLKVVRDRVGAQLLLRRNPFDLVITAMDRPEQEAFFRSCRPQLPATTQFVAIAGIDGEESLARLDAVGLDGVLHRPLVEADIKATVKPLLAARRPAAASLSGAEVGR